MQDSHTSSVQADNKNNVINSDKEWENNTSKQSNLTAGLKRTLNDKKQLSFKDEIESRSRLNESYENEEVFESTDEEEDSKGNAFEDPEEEDNDDENWEDDTSESADCSKEPLFHRVNSKPKLVPSQSLLTTLLNQNGRAADFANKASKSMPALRRSRTSTPPKPIVINRSQSHHQMALSPRTTRKNMLHSEMTQSIRESILWERQQNRSTAQAVLQRCKTAHANLDHSKGGLDESSVANPYSSEYSTW